MDGVIPTIRDSESLIIRVLCGSSGQSIQDGFHYSSYQPGFPSLLQDESTMSFARREDSESGLALRDEVSPSPLRGRTMSVLLSSNSFQLN